MFINGHGNKGLTHFKFPKLRIESDKITSHILQIRSGFPDFNCVALVQTCFSGCFGLVQHGCKGVITSTDNEHASEGNLLANAFQEVVSSKNTFTLDDVYNSGFYDQDKVFNSFNGIRDIEDWDNLSETIKLALCFDNSHGYSSWEIPDSLVTKCYPQVLF